MKTRTRFLFPLVCAATASLLLIVPPAQAGYIVTLTQQGSSVVATGSGAIDLTGLTLNFLSGADPEVTPKDGDIETGAIDPTIGEAVVNTYSGFSGPTSFGSGNKLPADAASGDMVGILNFQGSQAGLLEVPQGYVSNAALSDMATYNNTNFSKLGVTPGTFEWTWGTGANQNFTLKIEGVVTTPDAGSTFGLLFLSLMGLLGASHLRSVRLA